jgi:CRISPR-associated protein Cmr1
VTAPAPTRSAPAHRLEYQLRFLTPAFLGDAHQAAEWRTPPFKALLRQWWRVAYAQDHDFRFDREDRVNEMRAAEAQLFGSAAGDQGNQSVLRLRLDKWSAGTMTTIPETTPRIPLITFNNPNLKVDSSLYLGYGPVVFQAGQMGLKNGRAIDAGESARLQIAIDPRRSISTQEWRRIEHAMALCALYGALGGRSRNGWGSLQVQQIGATGSSSVVRTKTRRFDSALELDWPHAIGSDERPLVWEGPKCSNWREAMRALAQIRIKLRRVFPLQTRKPQQVLEDRHWLAYPVTNHQLVDWDRFKLRLPNSMRFRIRVSPDNENQLVPVVFHIPCSPPASFRPNTRHLIDIWKRAHTFLDSADCPVRLNRVEQ